MNPKVPRGREHRPSRGCPCRHTLFLSLALSCSLMPSLSHTLSLSLSLSLPLSLSLSLSLHRHHPSPHMGGCSTHTPSVRHTKGSVRSTWGGVGHPHRLFVFDTRREVFRGGLVFKAHTLLYHPTIGSRVMNKKRRRREVCDAHGTRASRAGPPQS